MELLCKKKDPIVRTLKDVLHAEIVKVPSEEIQPLTIIEYKKNKAYKRGTLKHILTNKNNFDLTSDDFAKVFMADISGTRTNSTSIDFGLKILDGFLDGFLNRDDLSANPKINNQFSGIKKVSFTFENVFKIYIDHGLLANYFKKHKIDKRNPSTGGYFGESKTELLIIDSIISSNSFSLNIEESTNNDFKLNTSNIEDLFSLNTNFQVEKVSNTSIQFKRNESLSFAFTCIKLEFDETGKINNMPVRRNIPVLFGDSNERFNNAQLSDRETLIDFE